VNTPFVLPGFGNHDTPNADKVILAQSDGSWVFDLDMAPDARIESLQRVGIGGSVDFIVVVPLIENFLDRSGDKLRVRGYADVIATKAIRGDMRIRITTPERRVFERVIRQTVDVTAE